MFCIHCGTPNLDEASFCSKCGKPVGRSTPADPPTTPPPPQNPATAVAAPSPSIAPPRSSAPYWLGAAGVLVMGAILVFIVRDARGGSETTPSAPSTSTANPAPSSNTSSEGFTPAPVSNESNVRQAHSDVAPAEPPAPEKAPPAESVPSQNAPPPEAPSASISNATRITVPTLVGRWKFSQLGGLGDIFLKFDEDGRYKMDTHFSSETGLYVFNSTDGTLRLQADGIFSNTLRIWHCHVSSDALAVMEEESGAHLMYARID